jgi:hypothetical protein
MKKTRFTETQIRKAIDAQNGSDEIVNAEADVWAEALKRFGSTKE